MNAIASETHQWVFCSCSAHVVCTFAKSFSADIQYCNFNCILCLIVAVCLFVV